MVLNQLKPSVSAFVTSYIKRLRRFVQPFNHDIIWYLYTTVKHSFKTFVSSWCPEMHSSIWKKTNQITPEAFTFRTSILCALTSNLLRLRGNPYKIRVTQRTVFPLVTPSTAWCHLFVLSWMRQQLERVPDIWPLSPYQGKHPCQAQGSNCHLRGSHCNTTTFPDLNTLLSRFNHSLTSLIVNHRLSITAVCKLFLSILRLLILLFTYLYIIPAYRYYCSWYTSLLTITVHSLLLYINSWVLFRLTLHIFFTNDITIAILL